MANILPVPVKTIAIVYHSADLDGLASRVVCEHWLSKEPNVRLYTHGWDHGEPLNCAYVQNEGYPDSRTFDWEDFDEIYIVDIAPDELLGNPDLKDTIIWIDHHETAIAKWDNRKAPISDNPVPDFDGVRLHGVAACRLAWQWFANYRHGSIMPGRKALDMIRLESFTHREVIEPAILRLLGEYDVWDLRDKDTTFPVQFGLKSLPFPRLLDGLSEELQNPDPDYISQSLRNVINAGRLVMCYLQQVETKHAQEHSHVIPLCGLKFRALDIGAPGGSRLIEPAAQPGDDGLLAYRFDGEKWRISLYHAPGKQMHRLNQIAIRFPGGGGHPGACGFSLCTENFVRLLNGAFATDHLGLKNMSFIEAVHELAHADFTKVRRKGWIKKVYLSLLHGPTPNAGLWISDQENQKPYCPTTEDVTANDWEVM